jgi:hypothetical protein
MLRKKNNAAPAAGDDMGEVPRYIGGGKFFGKPGRVLRRLTGAAMAITAVLAVLESFWPAGFSFFADLLAPVAALIAPYIPRIYKAMDGLYAHGYGERAYYVLTTYTVIWLIAAAQAGYVAFHFKAMCARARAQLPRMKKAGTLRSFEAHFFFAMVCYAALIAMFMGSLGIDFDGTAARGGYWMQIHKSSGAAVMEAFMICIVCEMCLSVSAVAIAAIQLRRRRMRADKAAEESGKRKE